MYFLTQTLGPSSSYQVHATFRGREYHFSWCRQPGVTLAFQEAQDYCEALPRDANPAAFSAVSIEDEEEDDFIILSVSVCEYGFHGVSPVLMQPPPSQYQSQVV